MTQSTKQTVHTRIAPVLAQMGLYFVDVETARMGKSTVLRIYVDKDGGLTMEDCEAFHRAIVDVLEDISYDYLEVSSPGDRPLKSDEDYTRCSGREVEVRLYAPLDGKKVYEGILLGRADGLIRLRAGEQECALPERSVAAVKPLFRVD
nr:ribosome maturation factor RimP [Maliibacterium massiliense]